jgi:ATP/maltotriose-dependent transcriptional regulator MalT
MIAGLVGSTEGVNADMARKAGRPAHLPPGGVAGREPGATKRFVGRERELRILTRLLDEARSGGSAAVAVVGEQGIGKTRFLRELSRQAESSGCAVLRGHGSELEVDVPFGPVVDALDDVVGELDPVVLRRPGDDRLAELGAVLPSLAGRGGRLVSLLEVERYRCHYAVRAALQQLVRDRPLVLVLDDMHWADPASVELLSYLLRRDVPGVLLALAFRPSAPRSLVGTVTLAARERALQVVELGPLSAGEAATMLKGAVGPARTPALYAESGGNPFYLEQLARFSQTHADGLLPGGAGGADLDAGVPTIVRATIDEELARLSPPARHLAHGAAVAGDPFDLDLAREVAEVDEPGGAAALDELVRAGIVRPTRVPGRLQFRHPLTRRAVYETTGRGWRLRAHRRAAQGLARRGAPVGAQAQHVARSAPSAGDEAALSLLVAAGELAAPRAPAAAAHWLEVAVRLLPAEATLERRLDLLVPLAKAMGTAGRLQDSRAVLRQALDVAPAGDAGRRARLTTLLAGVELELGSGEEARRLLETALAETPPDSTEAGELLLRLAVNHTMWGQWDAAARAGHAAMEVARSLGDRDLVIQASAVVAAYEACRFGTEADDLAGDITADIDTHLDQAAAGIDAVPDEKMSPSLLDTLWLLGRAEQYLERWDITQRHYERGIRVCRATGHGARFLDFMMGLVSVLLVPQGRLSEARHTSDVVTEMLHLVDNDQAALLNSALRCWVLSFQGQTHEALAAGEDALRVAERAPHSQYTWLAHVLYGEALVDAGQHENGRDRILAAGGPELSHVAPSIRPRFFRDLTEAELALGNLDAAKDAAKRARGIADRHGLPMRLGDAGYAEAAILVAEGQAEQAVERADAAIRAYAAARMPLEVGRCRLLLAHALRESDDDERAVDKELEAAHALFTERGAARLADRAARELRRSGRSVPRRRNGGAAAAERRGPGSLSPRERQVALLVTEGRTTRQIAEALFLSPKTIETHLAHIFAKLEVSSRAAMTATLERAHRLDPDQ